MKAIEVMKFEGLKLEFELKMVTPEMATKWLEGNVHNRDIVQKHVEWLGRQMRAGKWKIVNNIVAFSDSKPPTLLDGQHRLWAVVTSGTPVPMLVGYGFPMELQQIIDQGRRRSGKDTAKIAGLPGVTGRHVAAARAMMQRASGYDLKHVSNQDVVEYLKKVYDSVEFTLRDVLDVTSTRGFSQAALVAVVAQAYYTVKHDDLIEFGRVLISGTPERAKGSTGVILLRDFLIRPGAGQRLTQTLVYRRTQTVLESFLRDMTMHELSEASHNFFPIPPSVVGGFKEVVR